MVRNSTTADDPASALAAQAWISRFDTPLTTRKEGALAGLRFAVKDNIDALGLPTTAACPAFSHAVSAHASVVHRLLDAGASLLGKTNLDQFACGLNGTRSPYGEVPNAFNPLYVSGGSSSGSAYVVATGRPDGLLRRAVTAACGVLAQFGGVTLALAFIATIGSECLLTVVLHDSFGRDVDPNLLYNLNGLALVYTYFQIPLMVLVFLPAVDGIKPQWREATESLGGSTWGYWRSVAMPILMPPFLGALLLLFANAFSAYATAAALISQGAPIVPLQISNTFSSEVILGRENIGKAFALGMIVIVAVVMAANSMLQRRAGRWLR